VIGFFGQFFGNYSRNPNIWYPYFHGSYILSMTKNWLGYILGNIFKNSSGHPDDDATCL
jgi:hypothetical protein